MEKYKLTNNGAVTESGMSIPNDPGNRHWQEFQQLLADGYEPEPQYSFTDRQQLAITDLHTAYTESLSGGVEVVVGGLTILMDAGEEHAVRLKHGIELAILNGRETITVTDFHNVDHHGISISTANAINLVQANNFAQCRAKKNELRSAIMAATTEAQLLELVW